MGLLRFQLGQIGKCCCPKFTYIFYLFGSSQEKCKYFAIWNVQSY